MCTAIHVPCTMMSLRATCGRVRLALPAARQAVFAASRSRAVHCVPKACASSSDSSGHSASQPFTVTTPLYYVNAGRQCRHFASVFLEDS